MSDVAQPGSPPASGAIRGGLADEAATDRLGAALAAALRPGDFLGLRGGLGAGKSHLARAVIRARLAAEGREEETPSPTYTLVQSYETKSGPLRHADLYRLSGVEEVEEVGLFEAAEDAVLLVEWPDRLGAILPERRLEIRLEIGPGAASGEAGPGRIVVVEAHGEGWRSALAALKASLNAAEG